jgi:hypothetical protein
MEMSGQHHAPAALPPGQNPDTHWTGGWVGPRTNVDLFEEDNNLLPMTGYEPRTTQSKILYSVAEELLFLQRGHCPHKLIIYGVRSPIDGLFSGMY